MIRKTAAEALNSSYDSRGFFKSYEIELPVKFDNPFPLLTHSFMDWITSWDLSNLNYLEIGSGASTIFFQKYFKKITSFEPVNEYYIGLKNKLNENVLYKNINQHDVENGNFEIENYYDFCLIDFNLNRYSLASHLLKKSKFAYIILDTAEIYPNTCELIRNNGYTTQIDFWGFKNSQSSESSTTIFINDEIKLKLYKINRYTAPESYKIYDKNPLDFEKV